MDLGDILGALEQLGAVADRFKPHKPLLLLALLDLIECGEVRDNKFHFDEKLREAFSRHFKKYHGPDDRDRPLAPFFHLRNSFTFWQLKPLPGMEKKLEALATVGAPKELNAVVDYGYFTPEAYEILKDKENRKVIRDRVIKILDAGTRKTNPIDHHRPASSLFSYEAEALSLISEKVKKYNLGKWLHNLVIYDNNTKQYYEIDCIIISYSAIYVVELKHWSGNIKITPYNWIRNGKYIPDPHKTNIFKAKILRGIYQHRFRTYPLNLYFESTVVLTNQDAEIEGATSPKSVQHCPTFSSVEHLIQHLKHASSTSQKILDIDKITAVHNYFYSLNAPKAGAKAVYTDYEVVHNITQSPDLFEVIVRPVRGLGRKLFRFRRFVAPFSLDAFDKEVFLKRANNTLNAVAQIGDHPNILKVWPVPDDTGAVTEGSDWSEEGTLRDLIYEAGEDGLEESQAVELCRGILSGLHAAHAKGVIHRAVKPENILIINGVPKLMNFDLSYQIASDSSVTVIPDSSVLKVDPYTAPEVYALQDVDDSTDLFSVGVILYELLTGTAPFKSSRDLAQIGGRLPYEQLAILSHKGISDEVINFIDRTIRLDRAERYRSSGEALRVFGASKTELEKDLGPQVPNRILEPGETHDIFEIKRLIGEGSEAQVYEAVKSHGQPVALKVFHRDIPFSRIQQEEANAGSVKSSYLAHAWRLGHWKNDRYYIEMDYLDGRPMRNDILQGIRPDEETFIRVASCLLEAVTTLHERTINGTEKPLIHGDIKPDNIMLRSDGTAALFDFGCAGPPRVDTYQGTEGYVAPDLAKGPDLHFCESGDLFALGVSLFEWAFGKRPYSTVYVGAEPKIPSEGTMGLRETLLNWLRKAVQTSSEERFPDARTMTECFREAVSEVKDQEEITPGEAIDESEEPTPEEPLVTLEGTEGLANPFVAYLNSLHNASVCNENALAEAQALSPFFGHIHVPLKVTDFIFQQLSSSEAPHIILTGHAGDGKSTVALELYKRCKSIPRESPLPQPLKEFEELQIGENRVLLVKDMSELGDKKTLDLFQKALDEQDRRFLIVSNTGALLNGVKALCDSRGEDWRGLQNHLLEALEKGDPSRVHIGRKTFLIINLARTDNVSTACHVFQRMIASDLWQSCDKCPCRETCPIHFNVVMIRENIDIVKNRIELLYRRLYEYGVRLTLRQLTGQLAYALTGGLGYEDIEEMAKDAVSLPLRQFLFFNRFFGDAGESRDTRADQLEAVRQIRALEPGLRTHMGLERLLWLEHEEETLPATIKGRAKQLFDSLRKAASIRNAEAELPLWAARMQVRRILYLFGEFSNDEEEKRYVSTFLNSPMLWDFCKWQKTSGNLSPLQRSHLQQSILHVLQEHFTGVRLPENNQKTEHLYITLNRRNYDIRQSAQVVLAKYPAENFEFHLKPFASGIGEPRYEAVIRERTSQKELRLDLPFLDYVKNRFGGEIAQKLQSFFVDRLERFKVELLSNQGQEHSHNMMLVRLQLDQSFKSLQISVADGRLEVF